MKLHILVHSMILNTENEKHLEGTFQCRLPSCCISEKCSFTYLIISLAGLFSYLTKWKPKLNFLK